MPLRTMQWNNGPTRINGSAWVSIRLISSAREMPPRLPRRRLSPRRPVPLTGVSGGNYSLEAANRNPGHTRISSFFRLVWSPKSPPPGFSFVIAWPGAQPGWHSRLEQPGRPFGLSIRLPQWLWLRPGHRMMWG
jgi:hypothetical protein